MAALLAGNAVLLKHAEQTPLVAERMSECALQAGLPAGLLQHVHMTHALTADAVRDARVGAVAFTGSVEGGRAISHAAAGRFISVGYELGGKDAAYVCEDTDVAKAAANVIDGAMYNAGQSCCAVERVYVHERVLPAFLEAAVAEARALHLVTRARPAPTSGPWCGPATPPWCARSWSRPSRWARVRWWAAARVTARRSTWPPRCW